MKRGQHINEEEQQHLGPVEHDKMAQGLEKTPELEEHKRNGPVASHVDGVESSSPVLKPKRRSSQKQLEKVPINREFENATKSSLEGTELEARLRKEMESTLELFRGKKPLTEDFQFICKIHGVFNIRILYEEIVRLVQKSTPHTNNSKS